MEELEEIEKLYKEFCNKANEFIQKAKDREPKNVGRNRTKE